MKVKVQYKSAVDEATARIKAQQKDVENDINKLNAIVSQAISYAYNYTEYISTIKNSEEVVPGIFTFIQSIYLNDCDRYNRLNIKEILFSILHINHGFYYNIFNSHGMYEFHKFYKTSNGKTFEIRISICKTKFEPLGSVEKVLTIYSREVCIDAE